MSIHGIYFRLYSNYCGRDICNSIIFTIVTFQRSKRIDQIASLGDVMNELRDVDRELAKISSGPQYDEVRSQWFSRMFNSLEWLSFMINEKIMTDKKLVEFIKPVIIRYYDDTFLKSAAVIERDSDNYPQFKKLYQALKSKSK